MHAADIRITRVGTTRDRLGEGPIWDAETRCLFWIDSYQPPWPLTLT